jgi:hypothetical protein
MPFKILQLVIFLIISLLSQSIYCEGFSKLWGVASYFSQYHKLLYTIEPQIRLIDRNEKYDQTLLNAGIGTTIMSPLQLWVGQTYINYATTNDIAEDVQTVVSNEYRIWEQLIWRRPFFEEFSSRSRLEERRAFQSAEWAVRFRERVYWTKPIDEKLAFALNDEFFLNIKSAPWVTTSTFDQNRIFVGFFYQFTSKIGLNLSYFNQYINKNIKESNNGIVLNFIAYTY